MKMLPGTFRTRFLLGFFACVALLAYALYVQFELRIMPCPFCILQRIAFAALGAVFLLGGLHAPRKPFGRRLYGLLAFAAAAVGAGIAGRHVWVQLFPPPIPSCGASLGFMLETHSWWSVFRKVLTAYGDCSAIDWRFIGLSMPMWTLIWFVGLGVWALWAGYSRTRAPSRPA